MRAEFLDTINRPARAGAMWIPSERTLRLIALGALVVLAAALRLANLGALGEGNLYYTAAVKSMLQSWHNFVFVAAEPGGSVSIDKPPVGLWLQTLSAYFLGVNGPAVLLPQILAGVLSVIIVYHLVRRSFGSVAGLLAGLVLAITPVVVATDRNNTMDSTLILTLLLAAWAFIKATESRKLRYLLLGAALVGIGFNIKMLQAYLPLPAFYGLYLLGSQERLRAKLGKLALSTVLLVTLSLSWAVIVDLTPASQRPYVGSSGDNSELSLILGYNGLSRLLGMNYGANRDGGNQLPSGQAGTGALVPPQDGVGAPLPPQDGAGLGARSAMGPDDGGRSPGDGQGGPGGGFAGSAPKGIQRLFSVPLSKEASWLLPFGVVSALLLAFRSRLHWPISSRHQALVLWGGWLLTSMVFFSVAGFFHEYYLSILAPAVAALVGIGVAELWQLRRERPWWALGILLLAAASTLALQITTAQAFAGAIGWLPLLIGLGGLGVVALVAGHWRPGRLAQVGFACIVIAMLITPGIWSGLTMMNASPNQGIPSAFSGRTFGPGNGGGMQSEVNQAMLNYLESNTQGVKYLMAVPSSRDGDSYVLATGRPVLFLGGFGGQDKVETSAGLAQLVANGQLRFIYWGGQGGGPGGPGGQSDIMAWVTSTCTPVQGISTASGSAATQMDGGFNRGPGNMQGTLYDCKV